VNFVNRTGSSPQAYSQITKTTQNESPCEYRNVVYSCTRKIFFSKLYAKLQKIFFVIFAKVQKKPC